MARYLFPYLLFCLILISSCKKDYTCSCIQTYQTTGYTQYGSYNPPRTTASTFKNSFKAKKDEAKSICNGWESFSINTYGSGESLYTATQSTECEVN